MEWDGYDAVYRVLDRLREVAGADVVVLIRKDGALLGFCGDVERIDTVTLAHRGAERSLGGILRDPVEAADLVESADHRVHACAVGDDAFLLVFAPRSTSVGLVKLFARHAAEELARLVGGAPDDGSSTPPTGNEGDGGSGAPPLLGLPPVKSRAS